MSKRAPKSGNAFNAFAEFKTKGIQTQTLEDAIQDETLKQNFKHLKKKDSITKLKALTNISEVIKKKDQTEICIILPEWISNMKRLCIEHNRKIRQLSFSIFLNIIQIAKKENFSPHLKSVIGVWVSGFFDSETEVSKEAKNSFNETFPEKKRVEVLKYCEDDLIKYFKNIFNQTSETLNDLKIASEQEQEENFDRVVSSNILALDYLLNQLPKITDEKYSEFFHHQFFKFLIIKEYPFIRAATFKIIGTLVEKKKELLKNYIQELSPNILGCFAEKDPNIHLQMSSCLITFLKQVPESWKYVNTQKSIWPKLMTFLSFPVTSSPHITYQILLPFLSLLPFEVLESNEKSFGFFEKFFSNMWKGYESFPQLQSLDLIALLRTYVECLMFVIMQSGRYIKDDEEFRTKMIIKLLQNYFIEALKNYLEKEIPVHEEYCNALALAISKFLSKEDLTKSLSVVWEFLPSLVNDILYEKDIKKSEENEKIEKRSSPDIFIKKFISLFQKVSEKTSKEASLMKFLEDLTLKCFKSSSDSLNHLKFVAQLSSSFSISLIQKDQNPEDFYPQVIEPLLKSNNIKLNEPILDLCSNYFMVNPTLFEKYNDSLLEYYKENIIFLNSFIQKILKNKLNPKIESLLIKYFNEYLKNSNDPNIIDVLEKRLSSLSLDSSLKVQELIYNYISMNKLKQGTKIGSLLNIIKGLSNNKVEISLELGVLLFEYQLYDQNLKSQVFALFKSISDQFINEKNESKFSSKTLDGLTQILKENIELVNDDLIFDQMIILESFLTDKKQIWNQIIFNLNLWSYFSQNFKKNLSINYLNQVEIISFSGKTLPQFQSFIKYLGVAIKSLSHLKLDQVFLKNKELTKSWLIFEILNSYAYSNDYPSDLKNSLLELIENIFILKEFPMVEFIIFLKNQQSNEYSLKMFITSLPNDIKVKFLYNFLEYLFSQKIEEITKSNDLVSIIETIITFILTTNLPYQESIYNKVIEYISLVVSIIQENISKKTDVQNPQALNGLRLLYSFTLLFHKLELKDETIIDKQSLLDCFKDFYVNDKSKLNRADFIALKMFSSFNYQNLDYLTDFIDGIFTKIFNFFKTDQKNGKDIEFTFQCIYYMSKTIQQSSLPKAHLKYFELIYQLINFEYKPLQSLIDYVITYTSQYGSKIKLNEDVISKIWSIIERSTNPYILLFAKDVLLSLNSFDIEIVLNMMKKSTNVNLSYLIEWNIIIEYYQKVDFDEKTKIFSIIKEQSLHKLLLSSLTKYNEEIYSNFTSIEYQGDSELYQLQILYQFTRLFPSLIRSWFNQIEDKKSLEKVENLFINSFSPKIISHQLKTVVTNSADFPSNVRVKVMNLNISCVYEKDEVKLDVQLTIPEIYPLKSLIISSKKKMGVNEEQYRKWILNMTQVLFTTEGSIWESINLWKNNLDKHFDGVEACPICYSIVHSSNQSLPKIACKTCKNKFHSQCLYKWFSTSGNNTCPMCRSVNSFKD